MTRPQDLESATEHRRASGPVDGWATNIALAHLTLLLVGIVAQLILLAIAFVLGHGAGAIVGILVGFPLFLAFPVVAERLVGRFWVLEREGSNPVGWGYFMVLGLAALFLAVLGGDVLPRLVWQLRASEQVGVGLAEIEASAGGHAFFERSDALRVLPEPIGHSRSSLYLGDSSRVERDVYLAPLAEPSDLRPGCAWLAIEGRANESRRSAIDRLIAHESPWLVEPVGLDRAGHAAAVDDALEGFDGSTPCDRPLILVGSRSRAEEVAASLRTLGWMHGLAHLLPLAVLGAWGLSRRFSARRGGAADDASS